MRQLSPAQQDELLDRLVGGDAVEFDPGEGVVVPAALLRRALAAAARVEIRGATLDGELDLRHLSPAGGTAPGLRLERCTFLGPILLDGAHLGALSLAHSGLSLLSGVGLECHGRVVLDGIRPLAEGGECRVELAEARIGGRVSAAEAHLVALPRPQEERRQPTFISRYALCLRSAVCRSDVKLSPGLRAEGGVRLRRCHVEGSLWLGGATLVAGEGIALHGDGLRVDGRMSMGAVEGPGTLALFTARGPVDLEGIQVGGTLALEGAHILPATEVSLPGPPGPGEGEAGVEEVEAGVEEVEAGVEEGARGAEVPPPGAPGTEDAEPGVEEGAEGMEVAGPAEPAVTEDPGDHDNRPPYLDLSRGAIGGDLRMGPAGRPDRPDAPPIRTRCPGTVRLDGLRVGGGAFLQSLLVQAPGGGGRVSGIGLATGGDLRLDVGEGAQRGDRILGPTLDALTLERATIGGSLRLLHARLGTRVGTGLPLDLWNVSVSGNLGITHCRIRGDVRLTGARVGRSLIVRGSHLSGVLDAQGLQVPSPGRLELEGSVLGSRVDLRQSEVGGKTRIRDVQIRGARWDDEVGLTLSRSRVEAELEVGGVRLSNAEREIALRALDGIVRFRKTRLACYPGWWLVEALLQVPLAESEDALGDDCLLPGTIGFLVPDRRHLRERPVLLGGRSDAIHDFNRDGWLRLDHRWDSALDYLRFFPTYVSGGGASSFRIVEPGDPVLDQITVPEGMIIPEGVTLTPPRVERRGHSHFGRAALAYADGIFMADFRIDPDGSFTMLDDTPMGIPGEGERERMIPPFRLTRRRDEAFPPTVRGIARWGEYRWDTVLPDSPEGRCLKGGLRRALADFLPRILLENARIHTIEDQDGRGWGGGVRLFLDGLTYERVPRGGELDEALPGQENAAAGESPTDRIVSREEALERWARALARWTGDGGAGKALRYRPLPWLEPWVLVELPLPHPRTAGERLAAEGLADTFTLPFLWRDLEPGEAGRPVVLLQDVAGRPLRTFEGPLRPTVEGPEAAEAWARFLAEYAASGPFRLDRQPPEGSPPESTEEWTSVPSHHPWSRRVCQDLLRFLDEVADPPKLDPLGLRKAVPAPATEGAAGGALECLGWRQRWVARARAGARAAWRASGITDSWDPVRVERRLRWLQLQFPGGEPNRHSFRPQPFEAAAAAFRSEGETEEARRILSYKLQTKLWLERRLAYRILGRLNYWFFDFGLSWGRALATVTLLWVVGWAATAYVNRTGLLVVALSPAATWAVPGPDGEGVVPGVRTGPSLGLASAGSMPDGVYTRVECGTAISAPIYALDLMIPILELGQRTRCDIASDLPPGEAEGAGWWRSPALWSLLVPLYSILGALVVSMGLLTVSGVLRRRVES